MLVRTSDLIGPALDWAVSKAKDEYKPVAVPCYSTDWNQGGPILEQEKICTDYLLDGRWLAISRLDHSRQGLGPTLLIAGMRCYVDSQLGEIVEIPKELLC
jgi:hypothetical protein